MSFADLVLFDGNILTMDPKLPSAQALAVKNSRILYVGNNPGATQYVDAKTQVIYLDGKTVLPGFIDTHVHVVDYGRLLMWLNLEGVSSIKNLQTLLVNRVTQVGVGKWILGRALNSMDLLEKRLPSRQELDAVSPDNPVVFYCQSGQVCVVNSKALNVANIDQQNDLGIERTLDGELTGVLRDQATNFVWSVIPEPTFYELYLSTELALENFVQLGLTSIHWMVLSEVELLIIQKIVEVSSLPLRVYLIVPVNLLDLALQNLKRLENERFKLGGAMIFVDGYLASSTAALFEPYSDNLSNQGKLLCQKTEMFELVEKIQNNGLQLVVHAVGDRAVQEAVVNVIQQIRRNSDIPSPRIEQAAVLNPQLMCCIKKLNLSVSIQPCVVASEFSVWSAEKRLGERVRWLFPVKELLDCGVLVSAGSDCPMEPLNPLFGIKAAVNREGIQKVSVFEALQMYTVFAAQASSVIADKGSIEKNKLADLTVLSCDPLSVVVDDLDSVSVCFTVLGGVVCCSKN